MPAAGESSPYPESPMALEVAPKNPVRGDVARIHRIDSRVSALETPASGAPVLPYRPTGRFSLPSKSPFLTHLKQSGLSAQADDPFAFSGTLCAKSPLLDPRMPKEHQAHGSLKSQRAPASKLAAHGDPGKKETHPNVAIPAGPKFRKYSGIKSVDSFYFGIRFLHSTDFRSTS